MTISIFGDISSNLIEDGNFHKALSLYQELLNEFPNNANLNFKIGFCYLNTATQKVKSIPYLEFASKSISEEYKINDFDETNAPIETLFYLGKAYHVNYRFSDAEDTFIDLKALLTSDDEAFNSQIDHELSACQIARSLIRNPVEMTVTNPGRNINSIYAEHSPVISGDESILVFTSKRKSNTGGKIMDDGQYFEDIYISSFNGVDYTKAQNISKNINTPGHEASIGLSFDGSKLFIYKDDEDNGNIYVSNRKGTEWLTPEKLPAPINSKYRETHATISFDQKEIFFTSDRKGGFGGLDIYRVRKLPNGKWSRAQNMGSKINTPYDEDGPYFHPDGTSLFFASQGHKNMGGFDIFVSYVDENDTWSEPKNLGYPINTPDDDIYYIPSVDGRRAYYSSYTNNSIGNYDIFKIDLSSTHIRNQTVIAGFAMNNEGTLLEDAIITISDFDDEIIGIYTPDQDSKKFLFILPRGQTFNALFESSNLGEFEYTISVPNYSYDQSKQVVVFNDIIMRVEKDPEIEIEPLADDIFADEDIDIVEDTLTLDVKTIEEKSVSSKIKPKQKTTQAELLVASELYKNNEYIETSNNNKTLNSHNSNNDSIQLSENNIDKNPVVNDNNVPLNSKTIIKSESDQKRAKNTSIFLGIIFGLALIGSTIYLVLRRRKE